MVKRFEPELMWNYSPVIKPMPSLEIESVCDKPLISLCVSAAFVPYLLGLLEIYRWDDRFTGTTEDKARSAGLFRDLMEEIAMANNCCCDGGNVALTVRYRFTLDLRLEISIDNGETWTDAPIAPNVKTPSIPPPLTGNISADKCNLSTNVIQHLQDIKERVSNNLDDLGGLAAFMLAILEVVLETIFVFLGQPELIILVGALAAWARRWYGKSRDDWEAVWTSEIWDKMLCILVCHIGEDGKFTPAQWAKVIMDVAVKMPGGVSPSTPGESLVNWLKIWQVEGLNTAAATGSTATADCSDCSCDCDLDEWEVILGEIVSRTHTELVLQSVLVDGSWVVEIKHPSMSTTCKMLQPSGTGGGSPVLQWCQDTDEWPGAFPQSLPRTNIYTAGTCPSALLVYGFLGGEIGQITFASDGNCED